MSTPRSTPSAPVLPAPVLAAPASDMTSPYRGLTPYSEADAAYFFGRSSEIATITANLEVTRLTVFYGPSGVGKSSVLRAGVMHGLNLRAQANFAASGVAEQIPVYCQRWSSDPLLALSQALTSAVTPFVSADSNALTPPSSGTLLAQLQDWSQQSDSELLLILDQFEEFFLYQTQPQGHSWDASSFAAQLTQVINHSSLPVNVLLSLREDALARLDYFEGRIPALLDNRLSIGHLSDAAGREAVTQPLQQFNRDHASHYQVEEALVSAVLTQVGSGQVTLSRQGAGVRATEGTSTQQARIEAPYLQLVLTRIWQQEQRNGSTLLRLSTLDQQLGGAETIVRNYLDETLDSLSPAERALSARLLDRLVTPSGSKIALSLEDLARYAGDEGARLPALLERLQDRRLLHGVPTPGGVTQYEIFHDVLGPALLDWQERYQKAQAEEKRLDEEKRARAAAEQQAAVAEERAQLQAGRAEAQSARAEAEARRARQTRWALLGLSSLLLLLLVAIGFFVQERQRANSAKATAQAESTRAIAGEQAAVAAQASAQANKVIADERTIAARQAEKSALIAKSTAEAEKARADQQTEQAAATARRALAENMAGQTQLLLYRDHRPGDAALILARDAVLTTLTSDGAVTANAYTALRTALEQNLLKRVIPPVDRRHLGAVQSVAFRPDGQVVVSGGVDGTIRLWRAANLEPLGILFGHSGWVLSVAFSGDGQRIVSGGEDSTVRIWDVASGAAVSQLDGHSGSVLSVAFSPDGQRIVSGGEDRTLRIWETPEQMLLRAMTRIARPAPILTLAERRQFGIGDEVVLPGQRLLAPLMRRATALQRVDEGQRLARTGAISQAIVLFESALLLDPMLQLEPASLAQGVLRNQVQLLLSAGYNLARQGRLDQAITKFKEAIAVDDTLDLTVLTAKANGFAAPALVDAGRQLAQEGKLDEALLNFAEATELDQTLDLAALTSEAEALAATALVAAGRQLAQEGKLDEALVNFGEAAKLDQSLDLEALTAEAHITALAPLDSSTVSTRTLGLWQEMLALVQKRKEPTLTLRLCQQSKNAPATLNLPAFCNQFFAGSPAITASVPVTGTIDNAVGDLWQLEISAATTLTISLSADGSKLDPYLILYDPQFQLIDQNDDIEERVIQDSLLKQVALRQPGRYWILAGRCCPEEDGDSQGAYRLAVEVAPSPPPSH